MDHSEAIVSASRIISAGIVPPVFERWHQMQPATSQKHLHVLQQQPTL